MDERTAVAIIGAGPAGLAVGACLRRAAVDAVILEKEQQVASSWRRHYGRLHLHTIKGLSGLPYMPFPREFARYVPREQVVDYLDAYSARFELQPRFGEEVRAVRRDGDDWCVESTSVTTRAAHVVVASGLNAVPLLPQIPGLDSFQGQVMHSASYADAKPFAGRRVLIVGMGNTGAEIALDLSEAGAPPTISLRGGVHIVPRELFGIPIQVVATVATRLFPDRINDVIFPPILDLALGRLARYGIKRPQQGLLRQIATSGRIPVIDVGTVRHIRDGTVRIAPDIEAIDAAGVSFVDGTNASFDAIILATGYRPNYRAFLLDDDLQTGSGPLPPRLHFVGFDSPVTGLLREIAIQARRVADKIREKEERRAA